jgi:major membrane immunogen (membrane-anchored lipoprotein)
VRTRLDHHLAVAIAAAALLTACGSSTPPTRADGVEVATYEPTGEGGDAALLSGTVEHDSGCLKI